MLFLSFFFLLLPNIGVILGLFFFSYTMLSQKIFIYFTYICYIIYLIYIMLEKPLESPLNSKEIKLVNPKGNQPWLFIGRTYAKALILLYVMQRADSLEKTLMLGKTGQEKGATKDEMVGWHHCLNGHEFGQTQRDSEGQRSWACCIP